MWRISLARASFICCQDGSRSVSSHRWRGVGHRPFHIAIQIAFDEIRYRQQLVRSPILTILQASQTTDQGLSYSRYLSAACDPLQEGPTASLKYESVNLQYGRFFISRVHCLTAFRSLAGDKRRSPRPDSHRHRCQCRSRFGDCSTTCEHESVEANFGCSRYC